MNSPLEYFQRRWVQLSFSLAVIAIGLFSIQFIFGSFRGVIQELEVLLIVSRTVALTEPTSSFKVARVCHLDSNPPTTAPPSKKFFLPDPAGFSKDKILLLVVGNLKTIFNMV